MRADDFRTPQAATLAIDCLIAPDLVMVVVLVLLPALGRTAGSSASWEPCCGRLGRHGCQATC